MAKINSNDGPSTAKHEWNWLVSANLSATIICLSCFITGGTALADPPQPPKRARLRVLSFNCQFLPGLAAFSNDRRHNNYRAREIGRRLAAYDVVGLNEVFDDRPRRELLEAARTAMGGTNHVITGPIPLDGRFNGGLAIVSRFPIVETNATIYSAASAPAEYGVRADGWVAKGVLHARLAPNSDSSSSDRLDVFVTHLEARVASIRYEQFNEFAAFVKKNSSPEIPVLLLGDFNTRGNPEYRSDLASPYHRLVGAITQALPAHDLVDLWPSLKPGEDGGTSEQVGPSGGRRIDYIFCGRPLGHRASLVPIDVRVNRFPDEKVTALSDHSGVEAEFRWQGMTTTNSD